MSAAKRGLTAEQRLADVRRGRARVRRERMERELSGNGWRVARELVPELFVRAGELDVRVTRAAEEEIVASLGPYGVFAFDTAARLRKGFGLLHARDVHVYLADRSALDALIARGGVDAEPTTDRALLRPWPGVPRLFACVVRELPPSEALPSGVRVVLPSRLRAEVVGAFGLRFDLLARLDA